MLRHFTFNAGIPGDMAYQYLLVVQQVLPHALIGPIVHQLLEGHIVRPIIRKWNQDGLLHMICEVSSFTDFCKAIVKCSALGLKPQRVDKMICIALGVQIMLLP